MAVPLGRWEVFLASKTLVVRVRVRVIHRALVVHKVLGFRVEGAARPVLWLLG